MLIFLDVETTGLESADRICSIGLIAIDGDKIISKYDLVNEGKKISSKASSINHITNEMIKDKPKLTDSETYKFLQEHNNENSTIIAHNLKFDLKMLATCSFKPNTKLIDTLRVTKHLIPECEQFSLQFLRYELQLYKIEKKEAVKCEVTEGISAHNALIDSLHVRLLYEYLLEISSHVKMIELSFKNVLIEKFEFGKYSGRHIEEIAMIDRAYLEWMLGNIMDLDEDLRYSVTYNLEG
ncbi:exonuclease domain-containing protein [Candidatus Sulfurimonas baltica]|uniref:3'-5' exoribonuclease n=1 Tax=Candidatus Sulfurimonas baltica TaxID=2740404 RepID=A0A7S7LUB6_9BACT|nr:exonuclease domain-containing protein [Candidatus Sulfurimonas baltica]QOY51455.1 3'-5' exoribonuclease [Candidatus Sulfurimonas baltica]